MPHDALYRAARHYEIAYSYRDVPKEVDFFLACARRWGVAPARAIEIASGPGLHARELVRRGIATVALDRSEAMIARCTAEAVREGLSLVGLVADMRDFALDAPVDLAINLVTTITYLLEPGDLVAHFRSVLRALAPGGVYVVEHNHPNDYRGERFAAARWTARVGDVTVDTTWRENEPRFDWVRQRVRIESRFVVREDGEAREIRDDAWVRMTLPSEIQGYAEVAGFALRERFGALDRETAPDAPNAWRMVSVLQRP